MDINAQKINSLIERKAILMHYQPIISLQTGDIMGYEALMRGYPDSEIIIPLEALSLAREYGKILELEKIAREIAIAGAKTMKKNKYLFINIEPDILKDNQYEFGYTKKLLEREGLNEGNIVFEITEKAVIKEYNQYLTLMDNYRKQGYKIAIDDVGSGYSGLSRINDTKPEFMKIDMELVRNVNKDSYKRSLVTALVKFAGMTGVKTIAEGIETKEELETIIRIGVNYGQGFFIQKPQANITEEILTIKKIILDINCNMESISVYDISSCKIGAIANTFSAIRGYEKCSAVKEHLSKRKREGVAIINELFEPIGIVMKHELEAKMATQYGYSIYAKRPIEKVMDLFPIIVEYNISIKRVADIITQRENEKAYDNIIVVKNEKYYGIVSVKSLLQQITSMETNYARNLNPLTMLPGNRIVNSIISKNIITNKVIAVCYLDLDNFKSFNDKCGYKIGDKVIKSVARIIEKHISRDFPFESFIGHIGGDDFVFILQDNIDGVFFAAKKILEEFDFTMNEILKENVKNTELLEQKDTNTTASIGVYIGGIKRFGCGEEVGKHLMNIKKQAKEIIGSSCIILNEEDKVLFRYKNTKSFASRIKLANANEEEKKLHFQII